MARRRLTPQQQAARDAALASAVAPPEHLLRCFVEDWVEPAESAALLEVRDVAAHLAVIRLQLLARHRFRAARRAWAAQLAATGVRPPRLPAAGRPRRRPT